MTWIVIIGILAAAGLIALVVYAVLLVQKVGDVRHEIAVVEDRVTQVTALLGQLELPRAGATRLSGERSGA